MTYDCPHCGITDDTRYDDHELCEAEFLASIPEDDLVPA